MRNAEEIRNAIRVGWNLGNALDTFPRPGGGEKEGETGWGNPITTKAMIDAVAAKGFNIIRIPVTWFPYVDDANNYRIDPTHLARVREVVDYAMENQVFAILNLHHENQWLIPQWKRYETVKKKQCRIWEQIADYFKDYPDLLLFEAMNEPRIEGAENEWEGGTGEVREVLNSLQGEFIKLIRNSDGNNKTRSLLITTAGASAAESALAGLVLPNDENVMVSALESGKKIILVMGPGDFTSSGHYIVLTDYSDGAFTVNDPYSTENSNKKWTYEKIKSQIKNIWALWT